MIAGAAPPPVPRYPPLQRRQLLFCLLAGWIGFFSARHWLMPKWIERAESGQVTVAHAVERAIDETAGIVLACAGVVALACFFFNLVRRERQRRTDAAARELAFVTSLGHSLDIPFPSNNPSPRR